MKKYFLLIIVFAASLGSCVTYPDLEVEKTVFIDKSSLTLYVGDKEQLTASPAGGAFVWESDDPAVATVTNGLVEAKGLGNATVSASLNGLSAKLRVTVAERIALTDISLNKTRVILNQFQMVMLTAKAVPSTATEVVFNWYSEDPSVATVSNYGNIEALAQTGMTVVWCESFGIKRSVDVLVPVKLSTKDWKVLAVSDETASDGGGMNTLLDGNTSNWWHSQWSGGNAPLPHWALIDMITPKSLVAITTYRRPGNTDTKTVRYYVGDEPDADSDTWTLVAEGAFTTGNSLVVETTSSKSGRYLKLVLPDSNRDPFTSVAEIECSGME